MPNAAVNSVFTPAANNAWHLLATLHSKSQFSPGRQARDRNAWNRYYASQLTPVEREKLKDRLPIEDLLPLSADELLELQNLFIKRADGRDIQMPSNNETAEFSWTQFLSACSFNGFLFLECHFINSSFKSTADFIGSTFIRFSNFSNAVFAGGANFRKSIFDGVMFNGVTLPRGGAFFNDTLYAGHADFSHMKLKETAHFHRAVFNKSVDFKRTCIGGYFDFREAKVTGWAGFQGAEFTAEADFTDAKFQAPTNFDSCRFDKSPPQLDGATLHQRTNWRRVTWPRLTGLKPKDVEDLTDAYSCLKLEMDKQKRHHDELMFFSKELECRKVEQGSVKGFPISLYSWTCDYGQSIALPLIWLFDLILLCWNIIMLTYMPEITWDKALLTSIANSFGSFGIRKELMESLPKVASTGMQVFLMMQGIVALILIFLIGLGLRNRFRMK